MKKRISLINFFCLLLLWAAPVFPAENTYSIKFDGSDNWDMALYDFNIDVDSNPGAVQLIKTDLIIDEMGNITDATYDSVSGNIRAKKEIDISDPAADNAVLIIYTNAIPKGEYILEVNGKGNNVTFDGERMLTGGWARVDVDP